MGLELAHEHRAGPMPPQPRGTVAAAEAPGRPHHPEREPAGPTHEAEQLGVLDGDEQVAAVGIARAQRHPPHAVVDHGILGVRGQMTSCPRLASASASWMTEVSVPPSGRSGEIAAVVVAGRVRDHDAGHRCGFLRLEAAGGVVRARRRAGGAARLTAHVPERHCRSVRVRQPRAGSGRGDD